MSSLEKQAAASFGGEPGRASNKKEKKKRLYVETYTNKTKFINLGQLGIEWKISQEWLVRYLAFTFDCSANLSELKKPVTQKQVNVAIKRFRKGFVQCVLCEEEACIPFTKFSSKRWELWQFCRNCLKPVSQVLDRNPFIVEWMAFLRKNPVKEACVVEYFERENSHTTTTVQKKRKTDLIHIQDADELLETAMTMDSTHAVELIWQFKIQSKDDTIREYARVLKNFPPLRILGCVENDVARGTIKTATHVPFVLDVLYQVQLVTPEMLQLWQSGQVNAKSKLRGSAKFEVLYECEYFVQELFAVGAEEQDEIQSSS